MGAATGDEPRAPGVTAALLSMGALRSRFDDEVMRHALQLVDPRHAAALIRRHKVRRLADDWLVRNDSAAASGLRAELREQVDAVAARQSAVDEIVRELDELGRSLGVAIYGIKGLAARQRYPDPSRRDIGDWDVLVDTVDDAVRLTRALRERHGTYDETELPWLKRAEDGHLYGQVRMRLPHPAARVFVDVHFGGYSVRHCGLLRVALPDASPGWHLLDRAHNLALGVANAAGDVFPTVKDFNDLHLACAEPDAVHEAVRLLEPVGLVPFYELMLDGLEALVDTDPASIAAIRTGQAAEKPIRLDGLHPRQRWARTVGHAWSLGRRRSLRTGLVYALTGARYYRAPLRLHATRRQRRSSLPEPRPYRCVRLVPSDQLPADGASPRTTTPPSRTALSPQATVQVAHLPAGDVVVAAGDVFVPTEYFGVPRRLGAEAVAFAAAGTAGGEPS